MDIWTRIAVVALTLFGIVLPLAAATISGVVASLARTGEVNRQQIVTSIAVCATLVASGVGLTLALIVLIPGSSANWAWLTGLCVFIGGIAGSINNSNALERLTKAQTNQANADVREITSAPSAKTGS